MSTTNNKRIKLPPLFFVASIVSSLFLAAGIIGFFAPQVSALLADRPIAIACIVVGVALELWAVAMLLGAVRQQAQR
jgi:hypothetical protein